jgi:ribosomal protein S18 acetylase RimI-like enzyme
MEMNLRGRDFRRPQLPTGYYFVPWDQATLEEHAQVKFLCFHQEIDSQVFPCLADYAGCLRLMKEISRKPGFLPKATWLLCADVPNSRGGTSRKLCGTVQGVIDNQHFGAIQNLGIVPELRGLGLGTSLLFQALGGFAEHGVAHAMLEVTSQNEMAVQLYKRLGFYKVRTVYKVIDTVMS